MAMEHLVRELDRREPPDEPLVYRGEAGPIDVYLGWAAKVVATGLAIAAAALFYNQVVSKFLWG